MPPKPQSRRPPSKLKKEIEREEPIDYKPHYVESGNTDAFDNLLKPFYYGKALTDPIDTARDKWNFCRPFSR